MLLERKIPCPFGESSQPSHTSGWDRRLDQFPCSSVLRQHILLDEHTHHHDINTKPLVTAVRHTGTEHH